MHKVQLTLTPEETAILNSEARMLGYNLTRYIKTLISRKAVDILSQGTIYKMSQKAVKIAQKARQEHEEGKTKKLNSLDDLYTL